MNNPAKNKLIKGAKVFVTYGNFGESVIISNGRKNTFNHSEIIYKVQSITNGQIESFNELHFKHTN